MELISDINVDFGESRAYFPTYENGDNVTLKSKLLTMSFESKLENQNLAHCVWNYSPTNTFRHTAIDLVEYILGRRKSISHSISSLFFSNLAIEDTFSFGQSSQGHHFYVFSSPPTALQGEMNSDKLLRLTRLSNGESC